jgi:hypothetical protein
MIRGKKESAPCAARQLNEQSETSVRRLALLYVEMLTMLN